MATVSSGQVEKIPSILERSETVIFYCHDNEGYQLIASDLSPEKITEFSRKKAAIIQFRNHFYFCSTVDENGKERSKADYKAELQYLTNCTASRFGKIRVVDANEFHRIVKLRAIRMNEIIRPMSVGEKAAIMGDDVMANEVDNMEASLAQQYADK